jgi:UDP-GlcNAc:undecaprenyl-phosphate GlcNAc-1-phosphate transferase
VLGIPILDAAWVIARRLTGHLSPFRGDRKHLHFRLFELGLSHRQTVLFLYVLSAGFGASGIFLQAAGKVVALVILGVVMVILASVAVGAYRQKKKSE